MRPRLDQLEALLWIAKLGSFRSAAHKLRLSQPAVSGRIRELESEVGVALVDRSGYRPRLTAEGLEVLRYAEQMLGLAENFRARFTQGRLFPTAIRMGAADTFALTYLSPLLARIAELHPGTDVELDIGYSAHLDQRLTAGELDIAFLTAPTAHPCVHIEPLIELELAWLASPGLRLHGPRLQPIDLLTSPIISNPRPSHLYRTILEWFATAGIVPLRLHTCTSLTIMAKLTVDGFGISVIPPILVGRELARGVLCRLMTAPEVPVHYLAVAYRLDSEERALPLLADLAHSLVAAHDRPRARRQGGTMRRQVGRR